MINSRQENEPIPQAILEKYGPKESREERIKRENNEMFIVLQELSEELDFILNFQYQQCMDNLIRAEIAEEIEEAVERFREYVAQYNSMVNANHKQPEIPSQPIADMFAESKTILNDQLIKLDAGITEVQQKLTDVCLQYNGKNKEEVLKPHAQTAVNNLSITDEKGKPKAYADIKNTPVIKLADISEQDYLKHKDVFAEKINQHIATLHERLSNSGGGGPIDLLTAIKFTGLAREFLNDVNKILHKPLESVPVKKLVDFANKHCSQNIEDFKTNVGKFLSEYSPLEKIKMDLSHAKIAIQDKIEKLDLHINKNEAETPRFKKR